MNKLVERHATPLDKTVAVLRRGTMAQLLVEDVFLSRHCVRHDAKERTLSGQW